MTQEAASSSETNGQSTELSNIGGLLYTLKTIAGLQNQTRKCLKIGNHGCFFQLKHSSS